MPLMRIIFPKGSSQSPSIQCDMLQQQKGLRILCSRYPYTQSLPGQNHILFHIFQTGHFTMCWTSSLWWWVTSVSIAVVYITVISLQCLRGLTWLAKKKISSTTWGTLQHPKHLHGAGRNSTGPRADWHPGSQLGYLIVYQNVLDTSFQPTESSPCLASLAGVWWKN